ncbi:hypothetical protein D8S85_14600 [Butyricimonas faecalis]|uniref:Calx-beta domain-containing protein n=2 Tax=Butyricimonas faecalis TaxID=2093856 RepID=A0A3S9VVT0_9BACT|nr:hypothetical protein D8S85_14600 [Butyricimonas faecalis]
MKNIISIACLLLSMCFVACNDDDSEEKGPQLAFSKLIYTLDAENPLEVEIQVSEPVQANTSVKFNVRGAAVQGEEYELSADEFVIPAGERTASITVTPKNNFEGGKTIKLELSPVEGYVLGEYNFTLIEVLTKGQLICAFAEENYVLPGELEVRMNAKDANTGKYFSASTDTKVPFIVGKHSTAIEHVHYEFVDNPDKMFVIPAKKSYGTIKIKFLKWEEGKTTLFLLVPDGNDRVLPGDVDQTEIYIKGMTTPDRLVGKWAFKEVTSIEYLRENNWYGGLDEVAHLPENNLPTDILEFVDGGAKLKVHATGDMAKYFRDCDVKFLREQQLYLYELAGIGRPPMVTASMLELSQANVNFSGTNEKLRAVQVGFRLLDDKETLEVTVLDYEPTDFLYDTYKSNADYAAEGDFPMDFHMVRYHFTKVK